MENRYLTEESILEPCHVKAMRIDIKKLFTWHDSLEDLPHGTGLKGGIARKVLKVICGLKHSRYDFANEMNGDGDIDVVVAVRRNLEKSPRVSLRKDFAGMMLGEKRLEAKDIEFSFSLGEYFLTRDVTMNECLLFRENHGTFWLFYTAQAAEDVVAGYIRPSVHCLHNKFSQVWRYWKGKPVVGRQNLARAIVRYLKGHGLTILIDEHTQRYYREKGLCWTDYLRILKSFHESKDSYLEALGFLEGLGFAPAFRDEADRLRFWGRIIYEINAGIANRGLIFAFGEPDAERIEEWISYKGDCHRRWMAARKRLEERGISVIPDGPYGIFMPEGIENYPSYYFNV